MVASTEDFLKLLHGEDPHTFQTFDDVEKRKNPRLARTLHGSYHDLGKDLDLLSHDGAGIFITINKTNGKGRKASDITELAALFVDFDGSEPDPAKLALLPEPSIVVQSKNGKHLYWLLKSGEQLSAFTPAQKTLIKFLGSDKVVHNLDRVMRLPWSFHKKDPDDPFEVELLKADELRYTIEEVISAIAVAQTIPEAKPVQVDLIAREVAKVRSAQNGSRNDSLNRAAFALGTEVKAGRIRQGDAVSSLMDAAVAVGLSEVEAAGVIDRGINAGIAKGQIRDDDGLLLSKGILNGYKIPKPLLASLRALHLHPDLKFDVLVGRWTFDEGKSFFSASKLGSKLEGEFWKREDWLSVGISSDTITNSLKAMEQQAEHQYNSRIEYFDQLEWGGSIEDAKRFLFDDLGSKVLRVRDRFECLLVAKQLVATVARVYSPGADVQTMLVIQGAGNSGKTSFLRALSPRRMTDVVEMRGKQVLDPDEKRFIMAIEGRMMFLVDELEQLTSSEDKREEMKQFIDRDVDQGIRMHGVESETTPRSFTLWGTVNAQNFLPIAADDAIKRRFLPVRTDATRENPIDREWVNFNRDRIWAAAKALYSDGWDWHLLGEEWRQHDQHIQQFGNGGDVEELVISWMLKTGEFAAFQPGKRYLVSEIAKFVYGGSPRRYQISNLRNWLQSDRAADLRWYSVTAKGNIWYGCAAESQSEIRRLVEDEDYAPAHVQPQMVASLEPQPAPIASTPIRSEPQIQPEPECSLKQGDSVQILAPLSGEWCNGYQVQRIDLESRSIVYARPGERAEQIPIGHTGIRLCSKPTEPLKKGDHVRASEGSGTIYMIQGDGRFIVDFESKGRQWSSILSPEEVIKIE